MKSVRKTLLLCLCVVLVAMITVTGTLAYQSSVQSDNSDADTAVLADTGTVAIDQIEQERNVDGTLQDFTQKKLLLPAHYEGNSIPWAPASDWIVENDQAWKVVENNEAVIDKFVTVQNTGDLPVYVRTIVAFEVGAGAVADPYVHAVMNSNVNTNEISALDWVAEPVVIDGSTYKIAVATYVNALDPDDTTIPSLKQVYLDKKAGNEIVSACGETYEILVFSQAVQIGMGDLDAAGSLNEAFGEITADNHPWKV